MLCLNHFLSEPDLLLQILRVFDQAFKSCPKATCLMRKARRSSMASLQFVVMAKFLSSPKSGDGAEVLFASHRPITSGLLGLAQNWVMPTSPTTSRPCAGRRPRSCSGCRPRHSPTTPNTSYSAVPVPVDGVLPLLIATAALQNLELCTFRSRNARLRWLPGASRR